MRPPATFRVRSDAAIDGVTASAYVIPTDQHESDGTFEWDRTTLVLVEATAGDVRGLGYTYSAAAASGHRRHAGRCRPSAADRRWTCPAPGRPCNRPCVIWGQGICATAIAAVDTALWDLKARLLDLPLAALLGAAVAEVPVYGSGGFTSYSVDRLQGTRRGTG